ncbi:MAG: hypothetical protein K0V04_27100 [Deltaproteobacteria bacterium]|nr:hypothetical protein [Deltaproteobacteria bacterium]
MRSVARLTALVVIPLGVAGCPDLGSSGPSTDGGSDTTEGADESSGDDTGQPMGAPGVQVHFELGVDWSGPTDFYGFPFPSDLRLDEQGRPRMAGFPMPGGNDIVSSLLELAEDRDRWPVNPVGYFAFDGEIATVTEGTVFPPVATAPVLLVRIAGPDGPQLLPTVARTLGADPYLPANVLGVAAMPGVVLAPAERFAFVVLRSFGDAAQEQLGEPDALAQLLHEQAPPDPGGAEALDVFTRLGDALEQLGVMRADVAAATVFTTGDTVATTAALALQVRQSYSPTIEGLALDPVDGLEHPRMCELHGTIALPQFQAGVPPFDTEGRFVFEGGDLVEQRVDEVPVVITIPREPMPAEGYGVVIYAHGTDGLSTQVVDRGPVAAPGELPQSGLGPAHVVAGHGLAAVGFAALLNPERLPGGPPRAYLNLGNLQAYRDNFVQAMLDESLLLDALAALQISPSMLEGCEGVSLPPGASDYRLAADTVHQMGQSLGSHVATFMGAIDPRVIDVVATGTGGYWSLLMATGTELTPDPSLLALLLGTDQSLSLFHPALNLLELGWEAAEPLAYASRIGLDPLPGHPVRSIYAPLGENDPFFPHAVFDALSVAYGAQQAGVELWPQLHASLEAVGRGALASYPVQDNSTAVDGSTFTAVVVQYEGDGNINSHSIFAQLDEVKHQYGCLFETSAAGVPTVPEPAPLGSACAVTH